MINLTDNDILLFQGDSITDCGRRESHDGLGQGYVSIIRGILSGTYPSLKTKILNRGISGDRTVELLARWKDDCLDLVPTILSILVGVNDVWRIAGEWCGQTYVGPEEFRTNYRKLIDTAMNHTVRQLVLCSPTTIENEKDTRFSELLDERAQIVKSLAKEYSAVYVAFREEQKNLLSDFPGIEWTLDGCHPTIAGHGAMAGCWLKSTGLIKI